MSGSFDRGEMSAGSALIMVPRAIIVSAAIALILFTGMMMLSLSLMDLDRLLKGHETALKVGSAIVSFDEFIRMKELGGVKTQNLSNRAFADELRETLLWVETAREMDIDKTDEFKNLMADLKSNLACAPNTDHLLEAVILNEKLAELARAAIIESATDSETTHMPSPTAGPIRHSASETLSNASAGEDTAGISYSASDTPAPETIHLKTILVEKPEDADEVLVRLASGDHFPALNDEFSRSLYAPVGGDMGRKKAGDFPPGVFNKFIETPQGSAVIGFQDESGIHVFLVGEHSDVSSRSAKAAMEILRQNRKLEILEKKLMELKIRIPNFVHPGIEYIQKTDSVKAN